MALSSLSNFIDVSNSFSISNSINLNAAYLHTTNTYLPPPLSAKHRGSLCVKCFSGADLENKDGGRSNNPLKTIVNLYRGRMKKDVVQLSETFYSTPFVQTILKVWIFVSNILKDFQENLVFSVKPTTKDGSMVGIKWKVGWDQQLIESQKGLRIHCRHSYVGDLLIGNLDTLLDPLLQHGPMNKIAALCLGFFLLIVSLFCLRFSLR